MPPKFAVDESARRKGTKSALQGPLFRVSEEPELEDGAVQHYTKKIHDILSAKAPSKEKEEFCEALDYFLHHEYARVCSRLPVTPWAKRAGQYRLDPDESSSMGLSTHVSTIESSSPFAGEEVMLTI